MRHITFHLAVFRSVPGVFLRPMLYLDLSVAIELTASRSTGEQFSGFHPRVTAILPHLQRHHLLPALHRCNATGQHCHRALSGERRSVCQYRQWHLHNNLSNAFRDGPGPLLLFLEGLFLSQPRSQSVVTLACVTITAPCLLPWPHYASGRCSYIDTVAGRYDRFRRTSTALYSQARLIATLLWQRIKYSVSLDGGRLGTDYLGGTLVCCRHHTSGAQYDAEAGLALQSTAAGRAESTIVVMHEMR
jgi:hypothetical protein